MQVLYVIINGSLRMSAGKVASQVAHVASMIDNKNWLSNPARKVVVLEAKNAEQMRNFMKYMGEFGYTTYSYIDEGVNEVDAYSLTAMAVAPQEDWEEFVEFFKGFKLYGRTGIQKFFK